MEEGGTAIARLQHSRSPSSMTLPYKRAPARHGTAEYQHPSCRVMLQRTTIVTNKPFIPAVSGWYIPRAYRLNISKPPYIATPMCLGVQPHQCG